MIGTMDPIPPRKSLAAFSAIYIPIQIEDTHWILAVLYPGSSGQRGRSKVYDSHKRWTTETMTTNYIFDSLKYRLGDEYSPRDWTESAQQRSRPQCSGADSGLYVLANANSIALNLGMMDLNTRVQRRSLRWQFAEELLQSI